MKSRFNLGAKVFLKTDVNQYPRLITAVRFLAGGSICYDLVQELEASVHNECELSEERDVILATTNYDNK